MASNTLRPLVALALALAVAWLLAAQRPALTTPSAALASPALINEMAVHEIADASPPGHAPVPASPERVAVELSMVDAHTGQPVHARVALRDSANRDWQFGGGWLRLSVPPASGLRWQASAPGYAVSEWMALPDLAPGSVFAATVTLQPSP